MTSTSVVKVAVITGASKGIGRGLTIRLLSTGTWKVVMIARSAQAMQCIAEEHSPNGDARKWTRIIVCDLCAPQQIEEHVLPTLRSFSSSAEQHFMGDGNEAAASVTTGKQGAVEPRPSIHLLVNNAGGTASVFSFAELDRTRWTAHLNLNLTAPFLLMKYVEPLMVDHANIINIGSVSAYSASETGYKLVYSAAKRALQTVSKSCALIFAKRGIRVNNIEPGFVGDTRIWDKYDQQSLAQLHASMAKGTPLRRLGTVEDIVHLVCFLIDNEKAGWITGVNYVIDGGRKSNL